MATDHAKEGLVYVRIFLDGTVVEYLIKRETMTFLKSKEMRKAQKRKTCSCHLILTSLTMTHLADSSK